MRWMRCWLSCVLSLICTVAWAEPKNLYNTETPVTARCVSADGLTFESCGGGGGTGGDGAINDGVSSAIKATVFDYTNSNPLGVILRDTNGDYVSVGGGTQYNQGTAATDTDVLTMMGCVRSDTAAVATGVIDGDRARCIIDSTGRLWVFAAQSGTWTVAQSGTWNIGTVTTLTGITNPVTITDGAGALNVICDSGCGGGTQYAEDTAHASGDQLTMAGVVQQTADAALAADGDRTALQVDANGYLKVNIKAGAGSGGTASTDNSAFTGSSTNVTPIGAVYDTTPPAITDGNVGSPRMDSNRYLYVDCVVGCSGGATTPTDNFANPTDAGNSAAFNFVWDGTTWDRAPGTSADGLLVNLGANNDVTVTGTVTVTDGAGALNVIVDSSALPTGASTLAEQQTQTTALQLIDNLPLGQGAATAGQSGVLAQGAVTTAAPTYTTGNTNPLSLQTDGSLRVAATSLPSVTIGTFPDNEPFNVAQYGGSAVGAGNAVHVQPGTGANFTTTPGGNVAHGAADSGNPIKVGCQARTTNRTAEADADRVDCVADKNGQIVVTPMAPRDRVVRSGVITLTTTTETTLIAAGGAGVFRDLTYLKCTNSSATLTRVDLRDATAGTVIDSWALAANGGGFNLAFSVPYAQATANNNWTVQLSGAVTDVRCSAQAVEKN